MPALALKFSRFAEELRALLQSRTGRQTKLLFFGEMLNASLGFLLNVLVIRKLAVEDYGAFILFSSTMLMVAGFGHFGWTESFLRFGARYKDDAHFESLNRFCFARAQGCALAVTLAVCIAAPFLAAGLYHRPDITPSLRLAAVGGFGLCASGYWGAFLRARQRFTDFFKFQAGQTFLRVLGVGMLFALGILSVGNILLVYTLAPFVIALPVAVHLWRRPQLPTEPLPPEILRQVYAYNWWLMLALFTNTLIGNIDSHFLAHFQPDNKQMADFGVAGRLTLPIGFLVTSLNATVLPKLSAAKDLQSTLIYFDKLKKFLFPFAALVLVAGLLLAPYLELLAGARYVDIDQLLRLQIVALVLVVLVNPMGLVLYAHGKTHLLALMNVGQLALDLVLDACLIPAYGAAGAIMATIGVNLLGLVLVYYWTYRIIRETRAA